MENTPKTRADWREDVLKHFKLAKLMDNTGLSMFKVMPVYKAHKGIVGFTVSFCKFDGSTKCGWSWRRLKVKSANRYKAFVIPYSADYLTGLGANREWWRRSTPIFSDNYPKYFTAVGALYDELVKNIKDLYWKDARFVLIDDIEMWSINNDINITSSEIDTIETILETILSKVNTKIDNCYN